MPLDRKDNKLARREKFKVRKVGSKEDRKRPSVFMRLKTDESFKGIALFEPDPELDDNPGYLEYYDHYDKQANQYVPCAGDKCPFCAANDNPSTRALTVWYFPEAADSKDQIKVFTMNYGTISDITDESEEEDGILGKKIRIKRLSDKGDYKVKVLGDKPLTKTELKKAQKALSAKFEDGLEAVVERQLITQMERLKALEALEEDEDEDEDEEEEIPAKSKSKAKAKAEPEEDEDEEEEEEEEDEEEEEEITDEEEEEEDEEEEEEEDEEEEEAEEEEIAGGSYEIVKVNEKDEIFDLKGSDGKVKMWLGEGVDVDYDDAKAGAKVKVDATQDDEGDWIITNFKITRKAGKAGGKGGKGGKGGRKK
jgi:hypothetical protein